MVGRYHCAQKPHRPWKYFDVRCQHKSVVCCLKLQSMQIPNKSKFAVVLVYAYSHIQNKSFYICALLALNLLLNETAIMTQQKRLLLWKSMSSYCVFAYFYHVDLSSFMVQFNFFAHMNPLKNKSKSYITSCIIHITHTHPQRTQPESHLTSCTIHMYYTHTNIHT